MTFFTMFKSIIFIICILIEKCSAISCKDEDNKNVDWFVLYKLPLEHSSNDNLINIGVAYMYITANDKEIKWKKSEYSINDLKSIPGLSLQPFYQNSTSLHILYNDETPSGAEDNILGHTKGVVMSDDSEGFWLIHSVPHFPPEESYSYPETGLRYGQSYLCITMNLENINNVGKQLQYNQPLIYKSFLSNSLQNKLNNIYAVTKKLYVKSAPWFRLSLIYSIKGMQFLSFGKTRQFGKELYKDWVSNALQSNLLVETWLNGAGKIPSDCSKIYKVNNIQSIKSENVTDFKSSKDHSKWAVTCSENNLGNRNMKTWVCVGDINREEHQKYRGGGTVCFSEESLWNEYYKLIGTIEAC